MLVSKHAQTKTIYDEKFRGIVTEFLGDVAVGTIGDVAVGTIEEPPEPFFDIGDSVVYTGLTQRFNGSQVTTGMQGHVVNEVEEGFVKVQFDRVGRAVLAKRNLLLDGGDKLLSSAKKSHWILLESRRLTRKSTDSWLLGGSRDAALLVVTWTHPGRPLATATDNVVWNAMLSPNVSFSHPPNAMSLHFFHRLIRFYISIIECMFELDLV